MPAHLIDNLPALLVVLPLIGAALAAMLPRVSAPLLIATLVAWACFAATIVLWGQVNDAGVISYALGGWPPPIGIEYRVDALTLTMLLLITGIGAIVVPASGANVRAEIEPHNQGLFYAILLLMFAGLLGVAITGDAFNLFVFLEIQSLAAYVLVAMGARRDRRALPAAFSYLMLGTIGATFYVIGVGLAYMSTGTLNMADLAARLPTLGANRTVDAAFAFIFVGLALKAALFPLHLWLPNAYAYAPSPVSTFLAATSTKVAIYALVRFLFTVFGLEFAFEAIALQYIVMPLALAGMIVASLTALGERDVKRMLAYSSIAQVGYMLLGLSLATPAGVKAALIHLVNHGLMKGALFMALSAIVLARGRTSLDAFPGLGRQMPITMGLFVLAALSLIGVPPTVGFVSKWYLISAALEAGAWPLAAVVVATSLLAVAYVWRVVEAAYLQPPSGDPPPRARPVLIAAAALLAFANVALGIDARFVVGLADAAVGGLFGGAP